MRVVVFDLNSCFWTLAGVRSKDEPAAGLALEVLRYMRDRAGGLAADASLFASDGPPDQPSRSWRKRVDPAYKGDRKPKDEAQRAELAALASALEAAGFSVISVIESPVGSEAALWFEADDVVASLALKVATAGHDALAVSNDWDLAQVLAPPQAWASDAATWRARVRLFTTRGEERTAEHVMQNFGVPPEKLGQLKALSGDGDGYKPFPGRQPGKPGIGEKLAAMLMNGFESAQAAVDAALAHYDHDFKAKNIPPRIPELLRAGGAEALRKGLLCALLRYDVPVPEEPEVGDWEEAEAALVERKVKQALSAPPTAPKDPNLEEARIDRIVEQARETFNEANSLGAGTQARRVEPQSRAETTPIPESLAMPVLADEPPPFVPGHVLARTGGVAGWAGQAGRELRETEQAAGDLAREVLPPIDEIRCVNGPLKAESVAVEALPPEQRARVERQWDRILSALDPHDSDVVLTEAEFMVIAPLPALYAARVFDVPEAVPEIGSLLFALEEGELRQSNGLYIGRVTKKTVTALIVLGNVARSIRDRLEMGEALGGVMEFMRRLPGVHRFADYGKPLVRVS